MSTIFTPRDPLPRRTPSSAALHTNTTTPSSSARPSLDIQGGGSSSVTTSPNPNSSNTKRNRAALREYYNLRATTSLSASQTPTITTSPPPPSPTVSLATQPIDLPTFNPADYIASSLESSSLSDLLRLYTTILSEIRALDAEKKALVYDNYSKLITATETIRKMRSTMDPLNPMAGTLDLVVERVYSLAEGLRGEMRGSLSAAQNKQQKPSPPKEGEESRERREKTQRLAREVMKVPGRVRRLVDEGKEEEAKREWEVPRRLLVSWREKGVGGDEVGRIIDEVDGLFETGDNSNRSETVSEEDKGEEFA
ncbi:Vps51/Vps67-domain-containing protein [Cladorrhinum sp. PSN259]|nr:Vps51/Vps67-domain-containing protein [Cladorrhinum sp. PSN259]